MSAPRVLILGGGYTAIHLCRALAPAIRAGNVDATVVNRENYHVFHGFVGEMLTGRVSPSHILSPARRIFPPAKVHVGEIQKINLRSKFITTARSIDGARVELPFDQIVIALGSIDRAKLNPKGGSIALGHPFGATGARIVGTLAKQLAQRGSGRGLISICTAGGMGVTAILER